MIMPDGGFTTPPPEGPQGPIAEAIALIGGVIFVVLYFMYGDYFFYLIFLLFENKFITEYTIIQSIVLFGSFSAVSSFYRYCYKLDYNDKKINAKNPKVLSEIIAYFIVEILFIALFIRQTQLAIGQHKHIAAIISIFSAILTCYACYQIICHIIKTIKQAGLKARTLFICFLKGFLIAYLAVSIGSPLLFSAISIAGQFVGVK